MPDPLSARPTVPGREDGDFVPNGWPVSRTHAHPTRAAATSPVVGETDRGAAT